MFHMVRKDEMPETSGITKVIAETTRNRMKAQGISQNRMGYLIGKSQSYVSTRFRGEQAWTTDDIDKITRILGLPNGFAIMDEARGVTQR